MPIVTAGLYEVTLFQNNTTTEFLNVYWYWHDGNSNTQAVLLAGLFDTGVLPQQAAIQHVNINFTNIRVKPIFGTGVEANLTPTTPAGLLVGTQMNPAYAISLRLFRTTNETRSGWKRISGISEEVTNTNTFTAPYLTTVALLSLAIRLNLTSGLDTFIPQIVRKPNTTVPPDPNWVINEISSAPAVDRPTTQSSRKAF